MSQECYTSGSCVKCGCMTTALQMCNKPCEGFCYPPIVGKQMWNRKGTIIWDRYVAIYDKTIQRKYLIYKKTPTGYVHTTNIH